LHSLFAAGRLLKNFLHPEGYYNLAGDRQSHPEAVNLLNLFSF